MLLYDMGVWRKFDCLLPDVTMQRESLPLASSADKAGDKSGHLSGPHTTDLGYDGIKRQSFERKKFERKWEMIQIKLKSKSL